MTDHFEDSPPEIAPKPPGHGRLIAAGVVGAMALGVGMGLWARPAPPASPHPRTMAPEDAPRPELQVIIDDSPAPLGPLLEVLPGAARHDAEFTPPPPPAPEIVAPRRSAAGLMKVDAIVAPEPLLVPAVKIETRPAPRIEPKPRPEPKAETPSAPKVQKANTDAKADSLKLAEAKAKAKAKAKAVETAKAAEKARLAKLEVAKAEKLEKARYEKLAKAEKAKALKLAAQAEAKREKAAKAKSEARRLASLAKAIKAVPKTLKTEAAKKKTELAQARAARKPKVEKASVKTVVAKAPPPKKPVAKKPVPVGEGPMRVARNDACASSDPGEAVVCADRRLGARDRQLQQAYRNAEAAGVPASALRRQQTRWLQARAAAAREAPWAVEDVYEARISELNDLTRDAREN